MNHTVADVLPPSARSAAAAVDIIERPWKPLYKGTGDQIPAELLGRRVDTIVFDADSFGCRIYVRKPPVERDPRPPGTLANYGVS